MEKVIFFLQIGNKEA